MSLCNRTFLTLRSLLSSAFYCDNKVINIMTSQTHLYECSVQWTALLSQLDITWTWYSWQDKVGWMSSRGFRQMCFYQFSHAARSCSSTWAQRLMLPNQRTPTVRPCIIPRPHLSQSVFTGTRGLHFPQGLYPSCSHPSLYACTSLVWSVTSLAQTPTFLTDDAAEGESEEG